MSTEKELRLLQDKLDNHIKECNERAEKQDERWEKLIEVQEENTRHISKLITSTEDMVSAWEAGSGAIKALSTFGKIVRWLVGIGVAMGVGYTWFNKN